MMSEHEQRLVAYHEMGHALIASLLPGADPVRKVSIVPHSMGALGMTMQIPAEDHHVLTKSELEDRLTTLLGGIAAEKLIFDTTSTGGKDDIAKATSLARRMVCDFGMSAAVGPISYEQAGVSQYLTQRSTYACQSVSEEAANLIDAEVKKLIEDSLDKAMHILRSKQKLLSELAEELKTTESMSGNHVRTKLQELKPIGMS